MWRQALSVSIFIYLIDEFPQSTEIFSVEIKDEPRQMGNFRLITLFWEGTGEQQVALGSQDIAKMVLVLASGAADYMTGSLVVVDGGFLLS